MIRIAVVLMLLLMLLGGLVFSGCGGDKIATTSSQEASQGVSVDNADRGESVKTLETEAEAATSVEESKTKAASTKQVTGGILVETDPKATGYVWLYGPNPKDRKDGLTRKIGERISGLRPGTYESTIGVAGYLIEERSVYVSGGGEIEGPV